MATTNKSAVKVKEITDKLEDGVKNLFTSDKYAAYLQTMSRFHQYSTRNTLLIHQQECHVLPPGVRATQVAGYTSWQNNFKRQVKEGSKSIKIFAPIASKKKEEVEKIDPVTRRPIIGEDGQPIFEEKENTFVRFRVVSVFDVSQTDGEPLPSLAENITGDVKRYELFMDSLKAVSPLPVLFENLDGKDGECEFGKQITINKGMSEVQTVSATIHEIVHAKLHDLKMLKEIGEKPKDRRTEEVEAESISYAVCQYYGIETGDNSFGYIAEWSKGRELKELTASLDVIRKTAAELIDGIDEQYRALAKERNIDLSADLPVAVQEAVKPAVEQAAVPKTDVTALLAQYTQNSESGDTRAVGSNVLMTPLFIDGNFNRAGKKIRVAVEEPAGKYRLFSREEFDNKMLYFLTASGMIQHTSDIFKSVWDEGQSKYVNHLPTEKEFDEAIPQIAERFEKDLADPAKWSLYQHAAVLNRIDECEAHNIPVRKLKDEERKARKEESEQAKQEKQRKFEEKYDSRVNEIAKAIETGETIKVAYSEYEYGGKNPVLDLFKLYNIELPLRTQGWINTGLAELTGNSYRYYKSKHKGNSSTFSGYLSKLKETIKKTPIEQKRASFNTSEHKNVVKETKNTMEHELYNKFAEMFPDFINEKYRYMRLEASYAEPLSLEWIGENQISVMHTYTMNGDLMYDPMVTFDVDKEAKSMTAAEFEQSMPPLYQRVDENGDGHSIDGNGKEREIKGLSRQINEFSIQWLDNIEGQEFMPVKANLIIGGDEVRVAFDEAGNPIMPESEKAKLKHDSFFLDKETGNATWVGFNGKNNLIETTASANQILSISEGNKHYLGFFDCLENNGVEVTGVAGTQEYNEAVQKYAEKTPDFVGADEHIMSELISFAKEFKGITKEPINSVIKAETDKSLDMTLPDLLISANDRNNYGYTYENMLPLSNERAAELFDTGHPVFLLYPDNTEAMAVDRDEIIVHDGLCGIERDDWEISPVFMAQTAITANSEGSREADLLYGGESKFGIYQVRDDIDRARDLRFANMDELKEHGLSVDRENYNLVYTGKLDIRDTQTNLHKIFETFQGESGQPADYSSRSVSVSDVIVLQWRGEISSHFVDSFGFKELSNFLGEETEREKEQTSAAKQSPSVADIEADVKAGKRITLSDLTAAINKARKPPVSKGKPSLLARLDEAKQQAEQNKQPAAVMTERGHE